MAKKARKVESQKTVKLDLSPIGKIKHFMDRINQEDIEGQNAIFSNAEEMRNFINENIKKDILPYQIKSLERLFKKAGDVKGLCTWFDQKDVQVLLDVLEEQNGNGLVIHD